jgi:hypothetical protein
MTVLHWIFALALIILVAAYFYLAMDLAKANRITEMAITLARRSCEIKHSSRRSGKKENMDNGKFEELCKDIVLEYSNEHVHKDDGKQITKDDVYIVWICKTLQNNKALLSTKISGDGMYYEITYNGDKQQIYLDAYRKVENVAIDVVD